MAEPTTKKRVNLSLDQDVLEKGALLAERDNRSFSNFVEQLVRNEHARLFTPKQQPQPQEAGR